MEPQPVPTEPTLPPEVPTPPQPATRRRWLLIGVLLLIAVAGAATAGIVLQTQQPSRDEEAERIVRQAMTTLTEGRIQHLSLTTRQTSQIAAGAYGYANEQSANPQADNSMQVEYTSTLAYAAPNRWRSENRLHYPGAGFVPANESYQLAVSDGQDYWQTGNYNGEEQVGVTKLPRSRSNRSTYLSYVMQQEYQQLQMLTMPECISVELVGSEQVLGRDSYVLKLGQFDYQKCAAQIQQSLGKSDWVDPRMARYESDNEDNTFSTMTLTNSTETSGTNWIVGEVAATQLDARIWIDKATYLILKQEATTTLNGKRSLSRNEVTSLSLDPAEASLFRYQPPAGVAVKDERPPREVGSSDVQAQLAATAPQLDYPLFVPAYMPSGLVATGLKRGGDFQTADSVSLGYLPPDKLGKTSNRFTPNGLQIIQLRASYYRLREMNRYSEATPTTINGYQAWEGEGNSGSVSDSNATPQTVKYAAVMLLRDGTLITISGQDMSKAEVRKVAESLQPVAGGHAALPPVKPPTISEVRARQQFAVLVPQNLPAEYAAEPPYDSNETMYGSSEANVTITYRNAAGKVVLVTQSSKAQLEVSHFWPSMDGLLYEEVQLPNGATARYYNSLLSSHGMGIPVLRNTNRSYILDQYAGSLTWQQGGTAVLLGGPGLRKADLVKLAATMSAKADIAKMVLPKEDMDAEHSDFARVSQQEPKFKLKQASWLPDGLRQNERNVLPGDEQHGPGIMLGYGKDENGFGFDQLTLYQLPAALVDEAALRDPQNARNEWYESGKPSPPATASSQQIGGRTVMILSRNERVLRLVWVEGEVVYILNNSNDNRSRPVYDLATMSKVVEGIK